MKESTHGESKYELCSPPYVLLRVYSFVYTPPCVFFPCVLPQCVLPRMRSARVDSSMCSPRMYTLSYVLFAVCTLGCVYSVCALPVCTILCVCSPPYLLFRGCSPRMHSHPCVLIRVCSLLCTPPVCTLLRVYFSVCALFVCTLPVYTLLRVFTARCVLFFSRIHSPPRVFSFVYIFLCV